MATVKPPERKKNKKECKMHFTSSPAALGTFKLHPKRLGEMFFHELVTKLGSISS